MDIEIINQLTEKEPVKKESVSLNFNTSLLTREELIYVEKAMIEKPEYNSASYYLAISNSRNVKIMDKENCIYVVNIPKEARRKAPLLNTNYTSEDLERIKTGLNNEKFPHFISKIIIKATDKTLIISYMHDENVIIPDRKISIIGFNRDSVVSGSVRMITSPDIQLSNDLIQELKEKLKKDMEKATKVKLPKIDLTSRSCELIFTEKERSLIRFLKDKEKCLKSVTNQKATVILTYTHDIVWKYNYNTNKIIRPQITKVVSILKARKDFIKPLNDIIGRSPYTIKDISFSDDIATVNFFKAGAFSFSYNEAYKAKLNRFFREYDARVKEEKEKREKAIEKLPYFGTLLGIAIIKTIQQNETYITEGALIKELRGLKQPYYINFLKNEYTGKLNAIKKEEFEDIIFSFKKNHILRTNTLKGTYGDFDILKIGENGEDFLQLSKSAKHRKLSDMTEYELQEFLKKDDPSKRDATRTIDRLDFYLNHKSLYCCQHEAFVSFLRKMPPKAKEYLLTLSKIEENRTEKIFLKKLYTESVEDMKEQA